MAKKPFVIRSKDVPTFTPAAAHKGTVNRRLVGSEIGAKNVEILLGEVAPGGGATAHFHTPQEQAMYILEGKATVEVDGETKEMGPGDIAFFEVGRPHKVTSSGMKVLVIYAPPLGTDPGSFKTK